MLSPKPKNEYTVTLAQIDDNGVKKEVSQVHLGQQLSLLFTITNPSPDPVSMAVNIELQTGTQRTTLLEASNTSATDHAVKMEVKEVGVHVIGCVIKLEGAVVSRTFFKLHSASPFQLRTRINDDPISENAYIVAAHLSNASTETFLIDSLEFEPSEHVTAKRLASNNDDLGIGKLDISDDSSIPTDADKVALPSEAVYKKLDFHIKPRTCYQFVFKVSFTTEERPAILGRLDIWWRMPVGDIGHLRTGAINSPAVEIETFSFKCKPSQTLRLHEPGELEIELRNNTQRTLNDVSVTISHSENPTFIPVGPTATFPRVIAPSETITLLLKVIPVQYGFVESENLVLNFTDEWVRNSMARPQTFYIDHK